VDRISENVTHLLQNLKGGDVAADAKLVAAVYDELRRLAAHYMRRERADHTLQATALVHEAFLRLTDQQNVSWQGKAHFFGVAAQLMRRILIDHARSRLRLKRGAGGEKLSLDEGLLLTEARSAELLAVNDSIDRLAKLDPRQARIVELRFFGGLSVEETAEVVGVSEKTVKRDWSLARAWLYEDWQAGHGNVSGQVGENQGSV
jgi:RNA polymerase sigma-70 factor, ECF subfamily